jgi:hypothetical protein
MKPPKPGHVTADQLETEDRSRPAGEFSFKGSYALNFCRICGKYKWVYTHIDLNDGHGPGNVCGRCRREAIEKGREA